MQPGAIQKIAGFAALLAVGLFLITRTKVNIGDASPSGKNAAVAVQPPDSNDAHDKPNGQKFANKIDLLETVDLENVERTDVGGSRTYISPPPSEPTNREARPAAEKR